MSCMSCSVYCLKRNVRILVSISEVFQYQKKEFAAFYLKACERCLFILLEFDLCYLDLWSTFRPGMLTQIETNEKFNSEIIH